MSARRLVKYCSRASLWQALSSFFWAGSSRASSTWAMTVCSRLRSSSWKLSSALLSWRMKLAMLWTRVSPRRLRVMRRLSSRCSNSSSLRRLPLTRGYRVRLPPSSISRWKPLCWATEVILLNRPLRTFWKLSTSRARCLTKGAASKRRGSSCRMASTVEVTHCLNFLP